MYTISLLCLSSLSLPAHEDNGREHAWSAMFLFAPVIVSRLLPVVIHLLGKKRQKE